MLSKKERLDNILRNFLGGLKEDEKDKRISNILYSDQTLFNKETEYIDKVKQKIKRRCAETIKKRVNNALWFRKDFFNSKEDFESIDYGMLKSLNEVWVSHAWKLVKSSSSIEEAFMNLDFHCSEVYVKSAKNPFLVDFKGIIFKVEKHIYLAKDFNKRVRKIQKKGTIFIISLGKYNATYNGTKLINYEKL